MSADPDKAENADQPAIVIRMPNWLGDCVMAMPALRHLTEALPGARLFLAGRAQFRELMSAQAGVAGFIEAPASGPLNLIRSLPRLKKSLRAAGLAGGVDLGLLFTNSFSTALWLRGTRARIRIGYNLNLRRPLLTHPVPCGARERARHFINYYLWLAKLAESVYWLEAGEPPRNGLELSAKHIDPGLEVTARARVAAADLLHQAGINGPYAVIAPASAYGEVKDWPPEHYRQLMDSLNREHHLSIIVTGGAAQAGVCARIAEGKERTASLAGKTSLSEFVALLAEARLFVGGDSGGAHAAAALGTPTVAIFGVTNKQRTRPMGSKVAVLGGQTRDLDLGSPAVRELARKTLAETSPESVLV
ncbi:MAG: hypothetical protein LBV15_02165, partial [Planctomycetota bacterium]|nr:hypothetical protein [Planctomycetota bacterium]